MNNGMLIRCCFSTVPKVGCQLSSRTFAACTSVSDLDVLCMIRINKMETTPTPPCRRDRVPGYPLRSFRDDRTGGENIGTVTFSI
jgi:hypothetical protein